MSLVYTYVAPKKTDDPLAKLVLFALGAYADWTTGICWPSAKTLAEDCHCSERSIRAKIEHLEELGVIEVVPRDGKSPVLRIVGYREFYLETLERAKRGAENSAVPKKRTPEIRAVTPEIYARTPENSSDEHSIEHKLEHNTSYNPPKQNSFTHSNYASDWEQAPDRVSDQTENPSRPVGNLPAEEPREIAKRKAVEAAAKKISTNNWPSVYRANDPQKFDAWIDWFRQHNYIGQVRECTRRGYVFVPCEDVSVGAEIYLRKFPLANSGQMSNDTLSANGRS